MNLRDKIADWRFWLLSLMLLAMLALWIIPKQQAMSPIYNFTVIVDITRSMNVTDYREGEQKISRLEFVKSSLQAAAKKLPCGSKLGLGVFTERRSTLLFEPIEVCAAFAELKRSITEIDWRMAWAADSRIAGALLNTLETLPKSASKLIFVTDGQEAPPLNARYRSDFSAVKGKFKGLIVGAGDLERAPIPKFNARGEPNGFYGPEDVPHRSTFGESDLNPESIKGYNARNAPFGSEAVVGQEHLSALQENYLQQLAEESGLDYTRLNTAESLLEAMQNPKFADYEARLLDQRWLMALLALLALAFSFFGIAIELKMRLKFRESG